MDVDDLVETLRTVEEALRDLAYERLRAAAEVIGHLGARPERSLADLAADLLR